MDWKVWEGRPREIIAVAMMQKEKSEPELGNQDWREGDGDKRYPCREISNTW